MVKPIVQSSERTSPSSGNERSAKRSRSDGEATRDVILDATRRRLCEGGYARLNLRDIARDAGVNHALINYHFSGKQQLVLAVLDDANKQLLERQTLMYGNPSRTSAKWRQACDFYEQDLRSGFVRLMMELMGASFNDEALRREFVPRLLAWQKVIEDAVTDFLRTSELDPPVSARALTAWVTWFWVGIEASMTLGITEKQGNQREALDAVASLLRLVESRPRPASASPATHKLKKRGSTT